MKMLTKAIENKLPKLGTYESTQTKDVPITVKFFTPWSNWTWFVTEGEKQEDGSWLMFGMVHGFEKELGYFNLSELEAIRGPGGLRIERDRYYEGHTLSEVI